MNKGKMKMFFKFLLFLLLMQSITFVHIANADDCTGIADDYQGSCYMAYDFGFSAGTMIIKSNCGCRDLNSKDPKCGECQWQKFDPEFFTKGNISLESDANNIAITVEGGWKPWGDLEIDGKYCKFNTCNEGIGGGCYLDGKEIDKGNQQDNLPCCIKDGYGIYGLIALNGADPNTAQVLSSDNFRTFRVGPLKETQYKPSTSSGDSSDNVTIKTYVVDHVERWDATKQLFVQEPIPSGGVIYLKVEDSYYRDNVGSYKIRIDNGAFIKKVGFVEKLIDFFKDTFDKVEKIIYDNIVKESGFRTVVRILLVLFVIFTVIFFMLGLIEINQTELIIRLFKIGVVSTVISDPTLNAIPDLFRGLINATIDISTIIMQSSMIDPVTNRPLLPFPELNTVFSAYDDVIEMAISKAFNVKIWGVLFTSKFYLIIGIYICVILMFMGMWRSLVQYIMSFFLLALLIILLPIFIITILFKQTIHLFDNWIEQFISSCVMMIVVTATVALMLSLIITQLQNLLYYSVCWDTIFSWEPLGITIIDFKFWKASNDTEFSNAVTLLKFFYVLISSVLFRVYMDYVPELVDALGGVAKKPLKDMYGGAMEAFDSFVDNQIYGSKAYKLLNEKVLSPIQQRMGLMHYVDRVSNKVFGTEKDSVIKGAKGVIEKAARVSTMWNTFTGHINADLGVYDIKKERQKVAEGLKDLKSKVGDFSKKFAELRKSLKKGDEQKNRDLMQKMLSEDKKILDKSVERLDTAYEQLKVEKGKILNSKELLENKLDALENKQGQLDQGRKDLTLERQRLDDIQRNDAELMQLKGQRDPLDINKVEERYQQLLQERFGDQERSIAQKEQQLEKDVSSLEQERQNFAQQLTKHQQDVEVYIENLKKFEGERNLVQQQYQLYEEQQRVLDGGVSKYEIEDGLVNIKEQMNQKVELFEKRHEELSNSQTQLEERLRQLDDLNKELEQQRQLAEQLAREVQKNKSEVTDETEASQLKLNQALEDRYRGQQSNVEQLQAQIDEGREAYNRSFETQAQEYSKYSEDIARAQEEVSNTQYMYDLQKSELNGYKSSIQDKWGSDDLYLEPKQHALGEVQVQEEHIETAMEKIMKIREEAERYQKKMDHIKKLEEEIFEERRRIK